MKLTKEISEFIENQKNENIQSLALKLGKRPDLPRQFILQQIQGIQLASKKLPSWNKPNLLFPLKVSMEQCSSEKTSVYKSTIHQYDNFIDLTGGFGVDTKHLADHSKKGIYVESFPALFEIAKHNLEIFHPSKLDYYNDSAESFLSKKSEQFDLIYIDPDRRTEKSAKGVFLDDCTPNVLELKDKLLELGKIILIKTSPLIDIKNTLYQLENVSRVDIVSVQNECKEVLFTLEKNFSGEAKIVTVNFTKSQDELFSFCFSEEEGSSCSYAPPRKYIFEANTSILKAGGFKIIGSRFNLEKIAPSSHFYTSEEFKSEFPGKVFELISTTTKTSQLPKKANIISRNHPLTPEKIKTKGKIKDGGSLFILATSDYSGKPFYIVANRIQ